MFTACSPPEVLVARTRFQSEKYLLTTTVSTTTKLMPGRV